jgi:Rho GDP-dissociation inhibitor
VLGSFAPLPAAHIVETEEEIAPEGFMGRGDYKGKVVVIDGEGNAHLQY